MSFLVVERAWCKEKARRRIEAIEDF